MTTDTSTSTNEQLILTEVDNRVGVITLNRPEVLNALNPELMELLRIQLEAWDTNPEIGCVLIIGNEKAFAAGADIGDMADKSAIAMYERDQFTTWDCIKRVRKPIIAAVSGFALGGGCELMMLCDIVVASDTAQFGQPEINLGIIPGAGGTQRFARAVGKAVAMDVMLSGRFLKADEALQLGLVSRVVPVADFKAEALKLAHKIATKGSVALRFAKEAILKSAELPLSEGIEYERKLFYTLFATEDQKEGMAAFLEKRKPVFSGK